MEGKVRTKRFREQYIHFHFILILKGDQARVGIDLRLCHVQAVDDPERRYCFDLISPIR